MVELLQEFIIKVLGRVLPILVRWYYKPEKLAKKIKIQVHSSGDGVIFDCGEMPYARARLEVTNLSPFPVELERVYGHFWYGTRLSPFLYLKRVKVAPAHDAEIYIEADLSSAQVSYIKRNKVRMEQGMDQKLSVSAYVLCKVNNFEIQREVQTNNARLQNTGTIA